MNHIICMTKMKNGKSCMASTNDGSGKCGRHGGLSIKTVNKLTNAGYEPNGDRIMRRASKTPIKKKSSKKRKSRDDDGDVFMR
jgi:hypothetical protein